MMKKHICDLCYFLQLSYIKYNCIGGVMTNVHASSVVDRGFIGGVMVSVHASSVIDRGFGGFSLGWVKPKTIRLDLLLLR